MDGTPLGSLLGVFAHPDDEAYLAGALMALASDAGQRVVCVTATRGELGFPDDDPRPIAERMAVREAELAACLAELGVVEHHWLDHPDGGCHLVRDDDPVARLAALIDDVRPDTVLTFGPDGQTLHPDHISVSRWTTRAVRESDHGPELLYAAMTAEWVAMASQIVALDDVMMVPGAEPETVDPAELAVALVADGHLLDRKVRALRHQHSQVGGLVDQVGVDTFARFVADETFRLPAPDDWPA